MRHDKIDRKIHIQRFFKNQWLFRYVKHEFSRNIRDFVTIDLLPGKLPPHDLCLKSFFLMVKNATKSQSFQIVFRELSGHCSTINEYFSTDKKPKLKLPQNSFSERVFRKLWGVVEVTLDGQKRNV